ncbi:LysR family transcriptional regulator [Kitasatospora viridis]|uniref:DNA-binding transcriptional LysR family regulator n=1 Tax=Kitasatospora viridis TaxID=281105 RepID=A0A561UJQ7_9ACTN|nr:LysR family transcriptional regulator [Kitasatospora viridis]TWF99603.1 DNA-binding transcriptional LysR family regulator [Kitasatospora viridis]
MHEQPPLDLDLGPDSPAALLAPRLAQFAAVARLEHVTRAAEELGVPQPTLSRAIARLEGELGVALLDRQGRSVRLTRAGRLLLGSVERALVELDRGTRAVLAEVDPAAGRVAFGFLHTLGTDAVPALLREFRVDHPQARFQLAQDYVAAMLDRLRSGELDLCLVSPLPQVPDLTVHQLDEQELYLAVPADHRLARRVGAVAGGGGGSVAGGGGGGGDGGGGRRRLRLAEAAQEPFVAVEPGYGLRTLTDDFCAQAGFAPRIAFEGEEVETLRGLVAAGLGVALLPRGLMPRPGVVDLAVTAPRTRRAIGLAWLAGRRLPTPAEAFRDFVLARRGRLLEHG